MHQKHWLLRALFILVCLFSFRAAHASESADSPEKITYAIGAGYIDIGGPTSLRAILGQVRGNIGWGAFALVTEAKFAEMYAGPRWLLRAKETRIQLIANAGAQVFKGQMAPRFAVGFMARHQSGMSGLVSVEHDFSPKKGAGFWYAFKATSPYRNFGEVMALRGLLGYRRLSGGGPGIELRVVPKRTPKLFFGTRWIPFNERVLGGADVPDWDRVQIDFQANF